MIALVLFAKHRGCFFAPVPYRGRPKEWPVRVIQQLEAKNGLAKRSQSCPFLGMKKICNNTPSVHGYEY